MEFSKYQLLQTKQGLRDMSQDKPGNTAATDLGHCWMNQNRIQTLEPKATSSDMSRNGCWSWEGSLLSPLEVSEMQALLFYVARCSIQFMVLV